jgi:hypothetical protein
LRFEKLDNMRSENKCPSVPIAVWREVGPRGALEKKNPSL